MPGLWELVWKSALTHLASYFLIGAAALYVFDYASLYESGDLALIMLPTSEPVVVAGPLFQPIRGALFGLVFYLLRDSLFAKPNGWLVCWAMLAIIGILNPFGPAPGSIEGAVYTRFSWQAMIQPSMLEVYGQSLALAAGVFFWVRYPRNWILGGLFSLAALLAILASLAGLYLAPAGA